MAPAFFGVLAAPPRPPQAGFTCTMCVHQQVHNPCFLLFLNCPLVHCWELPLVHLLGRILVLHTTFRLHSPVKNPHTDPFQTSSKLGHPSYPSSRRLPSLPIRCHEIMSLESLKPFGIPKENTRQCHEGQGKIFLPIESRQQHDSRLHAMHICPPCILGLSSYSLSNG